MIKAKRIREKRVLPNVSDLHMSVLPSVDIFVTYCGEGVDLVADTLRGAMTQDYPSHLLRFIVLDDSSSSDVESLVKEMSKEWNRNLHYASRHVQVRTHAKADNLNFGVDFADTLGDEKAAVIAVLDVDMIPEPNWLRGVLPYLLADSQIGLANPMQYFYNIPPGDPLCARTSFFPIFHQMVLQDFVDKSLCTGTGFVMRRKALDSIGGFPNQSLTEDVLTSLNLSANGWKVAYAPGEFQWGLGPDSYYGIVRQRQRLLTGHMSNAKYICIDSAQNFSPLVRFNTGLWVFYQIGMCLLATACFIVLPFLILLGDSFVPVTGFKAIATLTAIDFLVQSSYEAALTSFADYRNEFFCQSTMQWMSFYSLSNVLHSAILPLLLGREFPRFAPTGLPTTLGESENSARRRGQSCLKVILWDCSAWIHLVVLVVSMACPLVLAYQLWYGRGYADVKELMLGLFTGKLWPPLFFLWTYLMRNAWTPVSYAFAPPPKIDREDLLTRSEKTQVAYPKESVKDRYLRRPTQTYWTSVMAYYVISTFLIMRCT